MDKKLADRITALKVAIAGSDPKNINSMTDAADGKEDIAGLVEKIMSKMDAKDGAGKYHLAASKRKVLQAGMLLIKKAFGEDPMGGGLPPAPPMGGAPAPTPMDKAMGETPADEAQDMNDPMIAPIEKMESEATGDPILEALLSVVEMIMKKEFGGEEEKSAPPAFGGDEEGEDEGSEPSFPPKKDSAAPKPSFPPKEKSEGGESEEEGEKKEAAAGDTPESEDKEDKEDEKEEQALEAEATLFLLRRKIEAAKTELYAVNRIKSLTMLSKDERAAKAASFRKLADAVEKGEFPPVEDFKDKNQDDSDGDDDKMDKSALKTALLGVIAALEAGENDKEYQFKAEPAEEEKEADKLEKDASSEDRKSKVLAHLAKLRIKKNANTESQPTPKEVPSPSGTVEDNDKSDVKVQYQGADPESAQEIQLKKVKIPGGNGGSIAGEAKEIYQGNDPESAQDVTSEKDSAKDINSKRTLKDMGTSVQHDHPVSPTEKGDGAGSHQKAKDWETAKSESDKTPTGPRLVGLASAIKLARLAEAKGMIATAEQYDELVAKYASYDEEKFAMAAEVVEDAPSRSNVRKAQDATFAENDAVEEADEKSPAVPNKKAPGESDATIASSAPRSVRRASVDSALENTTTAKLTRPLVMNVSPAASARFASLKDLNWTEISDPNDGLQ